MITLEEKLDVEKLTAVAPVLLIDSAIVPEDDDMQNFFYSIIEIVCKRERNKLQSLKDT